MTPTKAELEAELCELRDDYQGALVEIDQLQARISSQRKELKRHEKFYKTFQNPTGEKDSEEVTPEKFRSAIREMISRKYAHRDHFEKLSAEWWKHQNIIDGLKLAVSQVDAIARGQGAKQQAPWALRRKLNKLRRISEARADT